jgi:hypothetical protein
MEDGLFWVVQRSIAGDQFEHVFISHSKQIAMQCSSTSSKLLCAFRSRLDLHFHLSSNLYRTNQCLVTTITPSLSWVTHSTLAQSPLQFHALSLPFPNPLQSFASLPRDPSPPPFCFSFPFPPSSSPSNIPSTNLFHSSAFSGSITFPS